MRRLNELWNSDARNDALDMLDPDIEVHSLLASVTGDPYCGVDGFREWMADIDEQFDVWENQLDEVRDLGEERVLVLGRVHARGRESGVELDWAAAMVAHLRDGRLLRLTIYGSHADALEAVGREA